MKIDVKEEKSGGGGGGDLFNFLKESYETDNFWVSD